MKDAFYFSHDSNARHDPKISELIADFGMEGYGIFWVIIEMMREQKEYKLELKRIGAIAIQTNTTKATIRDLVNGCISDYNLFESDEEFFWSNSLVKRMKLREEKSKKAKMAIKKRWEKVKGKTKPKTEKKYVRNTSKVKESKVKKKKTKNGRKKFGEYGHVLFTKAQYDKLLEDWGKEKLDHMIKVLDEGIELKGYTYKNFNLAIRRWEKNDTTFERTKKLRLNKYEKKYRNSMAHYLRLGGANLENINTLVHSLYVYRKAKLKWYDENKTKLREHDREIVGNHFLDTSALFVSYAMWIGEQCKHLPRLKDNLEYFMPGRKSFSRYLDFYNQERQMGKMTMRELKEVE